MASEETVVEGAGGGESEMASSEAAAALYAAELVFVSRQTLVAILFLFRHFVRERTEEVAVQLCNPTSG